MRKLLAGLGVVLFIGACAGGAVPGLMMATPAPALPTSTSPYIVAAVTDSRRPETDTTRDALRHPAEIMAFTGVQPGWRVADIGPGGGYYSRLFAIAVGDSGRVYAVDRAGAAERPRPMAAVAPTYSNITHLTDGYAGWTIDQPLDAIFISQIYHDFYLTQLNIDVPALNRQMFAALKPGGVLVIIDHAAVDGSPITVTDTLHRIDRARVISDLTAAGFVLQEETDVLRNPADNRTERVFESDIRGHTDQFALRFVKPAN
jgi:predicted methyltransferase